MTNLRAKHTANYLYPGAFMPEETSREISEPTLSAALASAPDEDGYFGKDGWYAVAINTTSSKLFTAEDGEQTWVPQETKEVGRWIVGERIQADDIPDTERNHILIANIRGNSKDGYGVRTRVGNWQIASDYTAVLTPAEV